MKWLMAISGLMLIWNSLPFSNLEPGAEEEISLSLNTKESSMNSYLSICEIPATDFNRATTFYEKILDASIEAIDMGDTKMGLFPSENQSIFVAVVQGPDHVPSTHGVLVYLNGGEDLQNLLDKVKSAGGEVIHPKTLIDEENGYFAWFQDTEGNRLGVHSMQ